MKRKRITEFLSLLFYIFTFYQLWHLCQYGGVRRHLPLLIIGALGFFVSFVLRLIMGRKKQEEAVEIKQEKKVFYIELIVLILSTLYFGGRIVYSAIPYNGALSWKVDEWRNQKSVELKHNNFFASGVEGVLEDLDNELNLPEELYITNQFQVTFNKDGVIQSIYTFLYGNNEDGETCTYLVDYDAAKGAEMIVWVNGQATTDFEENMRLQPMLKILEEADVETWVEISALYSEEEDYEILYMGRRTFETEAGLIYLPGDVDGDGIDTSDNLLAMENGGQIIGFEVSLHIPDIAEITPARYIMEPEYISQQTLIEEHEAEQAEIAKDTSKEGESWTVDQANGTMYFFLNDTNGWRLVVTDAAAGSRFYSMEKTSDGGSTWQSANADPFGGNIGVTEGLVFFDENLGFAGLTGASQSASTLYRTTDGGATFHPVELPTDSVSELPAGAQEFGYTVADYDYIGIPQKEGDHLVVTVTLEATENEGIIFQSEDNGTTWVYTGVSES